VIHNVNNKNCILIPGINCGQKVINLCTELSFSCICTTFKKVFVRALRKMMRTVPVVLLPLGSTETGIPKVAYCFIKLCLR